MNKFQIARQIDAGIARLRFRQSSSCLHRSARAVKWKSIPIGFLLTSVILPFLLAGCSTPKWTARFSDSELKETPQVAQQIDLAQQVSYTDLDRSKLRSRYGVARASYDEQQPRQVKSDSEGSLEQLSQLYVDRQPNSFATEAAKPIAPASEGRYFAHAGNQTNAAQSGASRNVAAPQALPPTDHRTQNAHDEKQDFAGIPIDLANALGIAGANNLDIQFARERVVEAHAKYYSARASWLPTLRLGVGFNKHDGQIQATDGTVSDIDRNSLFIGGGAGLGQAPLVGATGGPARLFVNLSLADSIFNPLITEQNVGAANQHEQVVTSETLYQVSLAYFDMVEAYGRLANAEIGLESAKALADVVQDFEAAGAGSAAEVDRARTEMFKLEQRVIEMDRIALVRSERLKRILRYANQEKLVPADVMVVPLTIYPENISVEQLISEGMAARHEVHREEFEASADYTELQRETIRPLLPNLQVGASGGMFGGGPSTNLDNLGARSDLEMLAVWELQNMGLGTRYARAQSQSRYRQSLQQVQLVRDQIKEEISVAAQNVASYRQQMQLAELATQTAESSLIRNSERIREGEGLPIEMLQAIQARIEAFDAYTTAVSRFNQSQFQLIRAVGQVPYSHDKLGTTQVDHQ